MVLQGAVCAGMKTVAMHLPEARAVAAGVSGVTGMMGLVPRSSLEKSGSLQGSLEASGTASSR